MCCGPAGGKSIRRVLIQIVGNRCKLLQRRCQIGCDVGGDDFGSGQVGGFLEGVIFEPEDVEVYFVALGQLFVCEGLEGVKRPCENFSGVEAVLMKSMTQAAPAACRRTLR